MTTLDFEFQPTIESIDFQTIIDLQIKKIEKFASSQINKKVRLGLPVRTLNNIREVTVNLNERRYIKFLQETQGPQLFIFPKPFIEECRREVDFYLYRADLDVYNIELCSGRFVELTTARYSTMDKDCRKYQQIKEIQEAVQPENLEVIFREQQEELELEYGFDFGL